MAELVYIDLTNIDGSRLILEVHQIESLSQVCDGFTEIRSKAGAKYEVEEAVCDLLERISNVMAMVEERY
ncbi:hypothetical protein SEA_JEEVES_42 [Mycobacterium phage Jeeves]|uniref:Uncharacterized protein n=1 Tax=Mycobacterium phage Jeeves TaxID=2652402 RepID=A0A5J6T479_9CAUD|nr:hypothetical protein KNU75_gp067 [Mycobacterium phage Jeeves]QFG04517.1 hypothetical protein SEA_JEEVES_42 [Mycobacterium phage Jeeves]